MNYQLFHITTRALIVHRNRLLVMVSKSPESLGEISTPGGRIDQKELLENAFKRELLEELNLDLSKIKSKITLFAVNQRDEIEYGWDNTTQIVEIYYLVKILGNVLRDITPAEKTHDLLWLDKTFNIDSLNCKLESCRKIYKNVQKILYNK